jgi:anthranilate phosphoribosyltransferase
MSDLRGGDATANADIVRSVLMGEKGAKRDVVLLNAAYGLMAAGKASTVESGMLLAAEAIDCGKAMSQLEQLIIMTKD